jgi:hypothetical protein
MQTVVLILNFPEIVPPSLVEVCASSTGVKHGFLNSSPAINNQWGLADVGYAQTMPQLGGNFTYIFTPSLINETTVGMNLWTEQQKLTASDGAAGELA